MGRELKGYRNGYIGAYTFLVEATEQNIEIPAEQLIKSLEAAGVEVDEIKKENMRERKSFILLRLGSSADAIPAPGEIAVMLIDDEEED
jgi:hypothetical protein